MLGARRKGDAVSAPEAVRDWATDYDIFDPSFVRDPYPVWRDLRPTEPVARSERWGGSWMPTRYADVSAIAHDTEHFSSREIIVTPLPQGYDQSVGAPPITSDPPDHAWSRRLILPAFSPRATERYEPGARALCKALIDGFIDRGRADAAREYAQLLPPRLIAEVLGVDPELAPTFTEWVRGVLEVGLTNPEVRLASREKIHAFFWEQLADRRARPREDLISWLLAQTVDGEPVPDKHIIGTCNLLLVAGIDTTWSSIGSALWHLAAHPDDRRRLVEEPALIPTAVEELLRAYAPVTMARIVSEPVEVNGRQLQPGDRVLLPFPAANRDPEAFPDAERVVIDRAHNRHIAFGVGIHRCAGSNLARMEMRVAIEEWLARIPEFSLEDPAAVTWAGGQVRGPRSIPVVF
jgi:cytochrome P450